MALVVAAQPIPLRSDADGVLRVGDTRVTLDTVVAAFQEGMTPEGIAEQYPTLQLADLYAVIGYLLSHVEEVEGYLQVRRAIGSEIRRQNETRFNPTGVRARLLARRS